MATDKYANLPGVKITYEDGNLFSGNSQLGAKTKRVLVIGGAVDGPSGQPVSVRRLGMKSVDKMFGGMVDRVTKQPNGNTLVRGMYEQLLAGNDDVDLYRLPGQQAQTIIKAKDLARATEQFLAIASGNSSFAVELDIPAGGRFVGEITVTEKDKETGVSRVIANAIRNVDVSVPGAEKANFYANKMRPGNEATLRYDYETYSYTLVPKTDDKGVPDYSDPDYTFTRDAMQNHYFYTARKNWSNKIESGHIPLVVVKDNTTGMTATIATVNAKGEHIYRVGKGYDRQNPLTDDMTAVDYKEGGIFFTSAYDEEVAQGTYPDLTGNVTVISEYAWYTSFATSGTKTLPVPGQDSNYNLQYSPMADEFSLYYMTGGEKVTLPNTAYTLDIGQKQVTVFSGKVPVGVELYAGYKTSNSTDTDPTLTVRGKYDGELYGSLTDLYDTSTIRGIQVMVELDSTDPTGTEKIITFTKPSEKRLTSGDTALVYKTKDMKDVKTLRQFVQKVNTDPNNNIVELYCPNQFGSVKIQGLLETKATYLGEESPGVIKQDLTQEVGTAARYPWLGQNGLLDPSNQGQMLELFDVLGGTYEVNAEGAPQITKQGVYSTLENYATDIIVLMDVYANTIIDPLNPKKNFATQLAQHCAVVTAKTYETIGVIGMHPALETSLVKLQEYLDICTGIPRLISEDQKDLYEEAGIRLDYINIHSMYNEVTLEEILNEDGDVIDVGRYLNIVFGPEVGLTTDKLGNYVANGSAVYASLISTLNAEVSTTNKVLPSVYGLRYTLSQQQHNQLAGARYVTFDTKAFTATEANGTSITVKDGITAAKPNSDYGRLSTIRIVHTVMQTVRRKADPYIGLPNGLAQRNALSAEIQDALDKLKEAGVLQRFSFTLFSSAQDKVLGNAYIALELVPQYELRNLNTSVVLRAS